MIIYSGKVADLDADLLAGRVVCPGCGGALRPWGHARGRTIRSSPGSPPRWWRPRRGCCQRCGSTHVLLPATLVPRRRDSVEVIGAGLVAYASGKGRQAIAAETGLPVSTVRNWLRGFAGHAEALRQLGTSRYYQLDANATPIDPTGSPAADAVEALAQAARTTILRHGSYDPPWAIINVITAGALLNPGRLPAA